MKNEGESDVDCGGPHCIPCVVNKHCLDTADCAATTAACRAVSCSAFACVESVQADKTPCSDGNACTQTDTCQAGVCVGSNPVVCTALDQCHVVGSCNATSGGCSNPPAPLGTPCTGGFACSSTGTCPLACTSATSDIDCDSSHSCVAGGCAAKAQNKGATSNTATIVPAVVVPGMHKNSCLNVIVSRTRSGCAVCLGRCPVRPLAQTQADTVADLADLDNGHDHQYGATRNPVTDSAHQLDLDTIAYSTCIGQLRSAQDEAKFLP